MIFTNKIIITDNNFNNINIDNKFNKNKLYLFFNREKN